MRIFTDGETVYVTWENSPGWVIVATSRDSARMAGAVDEARCVEWRPVAEVAEEIAQAIEAARARVLDEAAGRLAGDAVAIHITACAQIAREYATKEG